MSFSLSSDRRPNRRRGLFRFYRRLLPQGLLPTGTGVQARERLIQLAGLALGALALATTLALLTFNANDPSLNTATARAAENWVGRPGAFWADLLLQGFGATAYLVPLLLLNWAVACLFRLERGLVVLRLLIALPALLMLAAVLSSLPFQSDWTKPSSAGGAGGLLVLENLQRWLFLPKAVSTVLCFVGGAIGMIFALGLERNLMPALGDPVGRERSRMRAAGGMDADGDGDGGGGFGLRRDGGLSADPAWTSENGVSGFGAQPWSDSPSAGMGFTGATAEGGLGFGAPEDRAPIGQFALADPREPGFGEEEVQEVYSDPDAVRVRLAESDTVYIPDSERDDFTIESTPPRGSVSLYDEDEDGAEGSIDHAGRPYGQTTYGVELDAAETVTAAWSFLKPKTSPRAEIADAWLENLAPDTADNPFADGDTGLYDSVVDDEFDEPSRGGVSGAGSGTASAVPPAASAAAANAAAGSKSGSIAERHVQAALKEAPRRVTRIGVPATKPQPSYAGPFQAPKVDLLVYPDDVEQKGVQAHELEERIEQLEQALDEFKIKGRVVNARPGPVVTLFEFAPAPGQRIARVVSLADDIKRAMAAHSTRIAVVPGTSVIGIELPNETRTPVNLRQIIDSDAFADSKARLPLALGIDIAGNPTVADLARAPHLLIAGTTGSGKSVSINGMILSLLYALPPERLKLIMIDPKMLELSLYDRIPHLLSPVVTDPRRAIVALKWAVREMEDRYETMMKLEVRGILDYNERIDRAVADGEAIIQRVQTGFDPDTGQPEYEERELPLKPMPYIVLIVDELADLMELAKKDIESSLQRLTQMGRAAGIHVITATQRPSVDVITGTIKANIPSRISLYVRTKIDSRTILDEPGAEQLLRVGDMLFSSEGRRPTRVHSAFVSTEEVQSVVQHLRNQGEPEFVDSLTNDPVGFIGDEDQAEMFGSGEEADADGDLYQQAVQVVTNDKRASTSYIQRKLSIGYNRAARLIERMEQEGMVGPPDKTGKREIYID
ncbi:MAG: DNA translocase FtsK 4TM domain-containing protein [Pseudomonadota bacterium]|nr:DNA translocase FtsK 4TM domain-containing protein [Pseudomonadota bacterium]